MLKEKNSQLDLWKSIFPKEVIQLNEELTFIDQQLNDEKFFQPYREKFAQHMGRPTIPVDTYHRLMYLKFRYQLGYETLVKEVSDSIKWRLFCGIPLTDPVADSTTLIKLTHKYGEDTVRRINELLLEKIKEQKTIRSKKLRLDTTVVESDIHYPTDASLLFDGIRLITRSIKKIKEAGYAVRTRFQNHIRKAKKRLLGIAKVTRKRTRQTSKAVKETVKKLLSIAETVSRYGKAAQKSVKKASSSLKPIVEKEAKKLARVLKLTKRVLQQTKRVLSGDYHIPHRIVSFFDPDARPIRRGKISPPTEFGRKVVLQEAEKGIVTGYEVCDENPSDTKLLKPAIRRHVHIFGKAPPEIATDRGFYSKTNERYLEKKRVQKISIPLKGKKSKERQAHEKEFWFKRLQRFRAGVEARISLLKRKFGLRRSRFRTTEGTSIWVGWGILAHNLWQTARII